MIWGLMSERSIAKVTPHYQIRGARMEKISPDQTQTVATQIKDPDLVERRRRQIVDASVQLFIEKGFHKTTTRQIAQAAGFSIGTLYEYVASKEDVLYLVCEAIHDEVEKGIGEVSSEAKKGKEALAAVIAEFFHICHRMSNFILLIYQETHALPGQWRRKVLANEIRINELILDALKRIAASGELRRLDEKDLELMAHNISVMGHMWTFRRWSLSQRFTIEEYIARQTAIILGLARAD
jgi:TetR/AcrR family transcriptional regulator, cholesterol catabolism regulator